MKRPQDWKPEEKLAAVLEAASLSEEDFGPFLRSQGLHESHLKQWHDQMLVGLEPSRPSEMRENGFMSLRRKFNVRTEP